MSDACVAQWLEQSTGNRKTWARIPALSKASFFPQKDFQILQIINLINIFLFLKYDDIKLKYNYSMYVYSIMSD